MRPSDVSLTSTASMSEAQSDVGGSGPTRPRGEPAVVKPPSLAMWTAVRSANIAGRAGRPYTPSPAAILVLEKFDRNWRAILDRAWEGRPVELGGYRTPPTKADDEQQGPDDPDEGAHDYEKQARIQRAQAIVGRNARGRVEREGRLKNPPRHLRDKLGLPT